MSGEKNIQKILEKSRADFNSFLEKDFLKSLKGKYASNTQSKIRNSAPDFIEILEYALLAPGKRLRPFLVELGYRIGGGKKKNLSKIRNIQIAIESLHTYSLIHDDLPSLDNDSLRRGRKTTHIVYGEANALLAGDSLNSLSFYLLSRQENVSAEYLHFILELFHNAVNIRGMITGQYADLLAEKINASENTLEDLEFIHRHKTGALISASFLLGFSPALYRRFGDKLFVKKSSAVKYPFYSVLKDNGDIVPYALLKTKYKKIFKKWEKWFLKLGLLFQIKDDLLDEEKGNEELGKSTGKDREAGKLSFTTFLGIEEAVEFQNNLADELKREIKAFQKNKKIPLNKTYLNLLPGLVDYIIKRKY